MFQSANFDNVKLGDIVKYTTGGFYSRPVVAKVTKVTAAQFAAGSDRFRKSDGKMIGKSYIYAQPATQQDLERQHAARLKTQLENKIMRWFDSRDNVVGLTMNQLETIQAIINQNNNDTAK